MLKLSFTLVFGLLVLQLCAQEVTVASSILKDVKYASVFTSSPSGRIIDNQFYDEEALPTTDYFKLSTGGLQEYHLTVLLRGRISFSEVSRTFAKTIWRCQQDTIFEMETPAFIPKSKIPPPDNNSRVEVNIVLTGPLEGEDALPTEIPLREFTLDNFRGNRFDFFGVDCKFSDLRKLGGLRNANFRNFRFNSWGEEPNVFLVFDEQENTFRELFLPAKIHQDSVYVADYASLPYSPPAHYFNLKPFDNPLAKLSAILMDGQTVNLGSINHRCQEEELVQHPVVSRPVLRYRKFLRYYVDRSTSDFTTITRNESSPYLEELDFSEIAYRAVDVVLGNDRADLSLLPEDMTGWEVYFKLDRASGGGTPQRSPSWYYKSGRTNLLPRNAEGKYSWSVEGHSSAAFVSLPELPEGAAALFFNGYRLDAVRVTGAAFTAPLVDEQVTYAYWWHTLGAY